MSTIFTKIIAGEIPSSIIYEDDICLVIPDKFPAIEGQSLVILKREVDYVFAMTDDEYTHMFKVAKKIAVASDKAFGAERTCLVVEGFEVPHVHIKLYPVVEVGDATSLESLAGERVEQSHETLTAIAEKIKAAL
jgi:histidine triad (HIT) family protein